MLILTMYRRLVHMAIDLLVTRCNHIVSCYMIQYAATGYASPNSTTLASTKSQTFISFKPALSLAMQW